MVANVGAEYAWLRTHYPDFDLATQSLREINGKPFDVHVWNNDRGEERTIYFDISGYYGENRGGPDRSVDTGTLNTTCSNENDEIISTFFSDQGQAIQFLVELKEMGTTSANGKYSALLSKEEPGKWLYLLENTKDQLYVGDYVKPFRCSQENIEIFNKGVREISEILLHAEALPVDSREEFLKGCGEKSVFGELAYDAAEGEPANDGEERKRGFEGKFIIKEFEEDGIQVLETANGKEAFVTDTKNSAMVPGDIDPNSLSVEKCKELIAKTREFWNRLDRDRDG